VKSWERYRERREEYVKDRQGEKESEIKTGHWGAVTDARKV